VRKLLLTAGLALTLTTTAHANDNAEHAIEATMLFTVGVETCHLSAHNTSIILRNTKEVLASYGYTMDTVMEIDRSVIDKVNAANPIFEKMNRGDQQAIDAVCPTIHEMIADFSRLEEAIKNLNRQKH
jgi:hypothetical protein